MSKPKKAFIFLASNNRSPKAATDIQKAVGNSTAIGSLICDLRKAPWHCDIKRTLEGTNPDDGSQINYYEILTYPAKFNGLLAGLVS